MKGLYKVVMKNGIVKHYRYLARAIDAAFAEYGVEAFRNYEKYIIKIA